jgi:hypothetical protein
MSAVSAMILGCVMATPPGVPPVNHNQPAHRGYPIIHRFERQPIDDWRRCSWEAYVRQLDLAWEAYRRSNSTPEAFCEYKRALNELRRDYVYRDPYYVAIPPVVPTADWVAEGEGGYPALADPAYDAMPGTEELPINESPVNKEYDEHSAHFQW